MIKDLPREPGRGIIAFADRVKAEVLSKPPAQKAEEYDAITAYALKFCEKYKIPTKLPGGQPNGFDTMAQVINYIVNQRSTILAKGVDAEVDRLLIEYDANIGETFGVARLNAEEKKKIHEHLSKIRELIESSDLSPRKKNALSDRLNALAKEVDSHGTGTDRFFAFVADLGFSMGEFGKNAKPLSDEVRGLIQSISRARARQEGVSLPKGDEPLTLPRPTDIE